MFRTGLKKCVSFAIACMVLASIIISAQATTAKATIPALYYADSSNCWLSGTGTITSNPLVRPYAYCFSGKNITVISNPGYYFATGLYNVIVEKPMTKQQLYSGSGNTTDKRITIGVFYNSQRQSFATTPVNQKSSASASL